MTIAAGSGASADFGIALEDSQPTLTAVCRKDDLSYRDASLPLMGINNVNGVLTWGDTSKKSTFQDSCGAIQIFVQGPTVYLAAVCYFSDGDPGASSLVLEGITNVDGRLEVEPS